LDRDRRAFTTMKETIMATHTDPPQTVTAPRHFDEAERSWRDAVAASARRALDFYGEPMAATITREMDIVLRGDAWHDPIGGGGKVRSQTDPQRIYQITTSCECEAASFAADQPVCCKHAIALLIHRKAEQMQKEFAPQRELPEAPVSVNAYVLIEGRQVMLTLRGFDATAVLDEFQAIVQQIGEPTPGSAPAAAAPVPLPVTTPAVAPPPPPAPPPLAPPAAGAGRPPRCPQHQQEMKPSKFDGG